MCPKQCASDSTSGEGVWREGGESSFILAFEDHVSVNHGKLLLFGFAIGHKVQVTSKDED